MFSDTNKLFCNTTSINRLKARKAINELYRWCNTKSLTSDFWRSYTTAQPCREPEIIFADGPDEVVDLFNIKNDTELVDLERFNDMAYFINKRGYGSKERVRSVVAQVFSHLLPYKRTPRCWASPLFMPVEHLYNNKRGDYKNEWEDLASKVWDDTYLCFTYKDRCYVVDRPSLVHTNERGLHCKNGPAIVFRDGSEIYCYEGIKVKKDNILYPERMTLKDIHIHNSRKHIMIDLCGIDRYLEMCKAWKPDVKGKFAKFFHMSEMKPESGSWDLRVYGKDWNGYGHMYKDKPAYVRFSHRDVNGNYSLSLEDNYHQVWAFWDCYNIHPFDNEWAAGIFNKEDRVLWDLLDINEMMSRGVLRFSIKFQNGIFSLESDREYYEGFPPCSHDIAPSWFKTKMFRGEDALYENEELNYAIAYKDGKLMYDGDIEQGNGGRMKGEPNKPLKVHNSLFGGCENLPSYHFDLDIIKSDSWEGFLEKWARLAFNWLGMHEDSTRLP